MLDRPVGVSGGDVLPGTGPTDLRQDRFYWVGRINQASAVMLAERGIVSPELGRLIARGVRQAIDQADTAQGHRPGDLLQIEQLITDAAGPEASRVHSGRSRQDIYATFNAAKLRTQILDYADATNRARARVLEIASRHIDTIIPAYTNGVQAMPISYAHYLLGYEASFDRDGERLRQFYPRANLCAMGTAVLSNSGWPLDRARMAALLGFDGIAEHSLDAGQIAGYDIALEAVGIAASTAIRIGAVLGDIHVQYHQTRPWIMIAEGSTYTSSAMPQKRNPGILMRARESASDVVGLAHAVTLRAHNVTTGMTDYKAAWQTLGVFPAAVRMQDEFDRVLAALVVDAERSLEELDADWTTTMELADSLQRMHDIPFRVGHGFASAIVSYARERAIKPKEFPYDQARRLFGEVTARFALAETELPMDEKSFRATLSPRAMVQSRVGVGGPQPAEVARMLDQARATLDHDRTWVRMRREKLAQADRMLDAAFDALHGPG